MDNNIQPDYSSAYAKIYEKATPESGTGKYYKEGKPTAKQLANRKSTEKTPAQKAATAKYDKIKALTNAGKHKEASALYKEAKYDNTKSPDYEKKKAALAKKHGGADKIKGHPQYEEVKGRHRLAYEKYKTELNDNYVTKFSEWTKNLHEQGYDLAKWELSELLDTYIRENDLFHAKESIHEAVQLAEEGIQARAGGMQKGFASGLCPDCGVFGCTIDHSSEEKEDEEVSESIEAAVEYFYEAGINEEGIDLIIEEVGLDDFVGAVLEKVATGPRLGEPREKGATHVNAGEGEKIASRTRKWMYDRGQKGSPGLDAMKARTAEHKARRGVKEEVELLDERKARRLNVKTKKTIWKTVEKDAAAEAKRKENKTGEYKETPKKKPKIGLSYKTTVKGGSKPPRTQKGAMAYDGPNKERSEAADRVKAKTKAKKAVKPVAKKVKVVKAVPKAKATQPAKKASKEGIADKIRGAVKAGVKRHKKAVQPARVFAKGAVKGAKDTVKFAGKVKKVLTGEELSDWKSELLHEADITDILARLEKKRISKGGDPEESPLPAMRKYHSKKKKKVKKGDWIGPPPKKTNEEVVLDEEGYDHWRDKQLDKYGTGWRGTDRSGPSSPPPSSKKTKGKTVLQRETEKKYGKGKSALDIVKAKIEAEHGKGAIMDTKKKKK